MAQVTEQAEPQSAELLAPALLPDPSKVQELTLALQAAPLTEIYSFGRELGADTARQTDALLEQVKSKDLETMGGRLSEIVTVARGLNIGALSDGRSRVPLIGGLIDKLRVRGGTLALKFQDVRGQIDSLVGELETMKGNLGSRVETLEQAYGAVTREHALLGAYIEAGEAVLVTRRESTASMDLAAAEDPVLAQSLHDHRAALAALDKRIADMRLLQHAALQQLPMIRMVQANNRALIEKFHNVKELTSPAWKRQFMLALSLNEQKNAVNLAETIDDATNAFMLENARLLKENTVNTARANQRQVIDMQTLQQVHESLLSTVQEVVRINREGAEQRSNVSAQLLTLRREMNARLGAD